MSYCGIILSSEKSKETKVSFLSEESLDVFSVDSNEEIVELLEEFEPSIVSVDVGTTQGPDTFTSDEEDLKEKGYNFTPNSFETKKVRRLEVLKEHALRQLGRKSADFIRFDPVITAEELSLHSDSALESLGIETGSITDSREFDSVLGAVTARFYDEGQFEKNGIVIPESL